jgi:hypothetical protein
MVAQFMVLPPFQKVCALFTQLTGKKLVAGISWASWESYEPEVLEWLRHYIRPCHQKILNETISGEQPNPLALLRQLLRPHGFRIEAEHGRSFWTVTNASPSLKGVHVKDGTLIDWSL